MVESITEIIELWQRTYENRTFASQNIIITLNVPSPNKVRHLRRGSMNSGLMKINAIEPSVPRQLPAYKWRIGWNSSMVLTMSANVCGVAGTFRLRCRFIEPRTVVNGTVTATSRNLSLENFNFKITLFGIDVIIMIWEIRRGVYITSYSYSNDKFRYISSRGWYVVLHNLKSSRLNWILETANGSPSCVWSTMPLLSISRSSLTT